MALTPLDISNKNFSRALRGYDIDEVNEFLDHVIKDFESLIHENKELIEKNKMLEDKAEHFSRLEENLSKSIVVAQETSEEVKSNAHKEAKLIIKEAEKNADRIINESIVRSHSIATDAQEIKNQARIYRARLRSLIEAQLELLESTDWDNLNINSDDDL